MERNLYRKSINDFNATKLIIGKHDNLQWFYLKKGFPLLDNKVNETQTEFRLTNQEKELSQKMDELRKVYQINYEQDNERFIADRPFYDVKDIISADSLFTNVFRIMPKGGLLHVHSSAALSIEKYFELLTEWDARYNSLDKPGAPPPPNSIFVVIEDVTDQDGKLKIPKFTLLYNSTVQTYKVKFPTITVSPISLYITEPLKKDLMDNLCFCSNRTESSPYIWNELNLMFLRIDDLFTDKEFFTIYHEKFFSECIEDNIEYIELRSGYTIFKNTTAPMLSAEHTTFLTALHPEYSVEHHFYFKEMMLNINYENPEFIECILSAVNKANLIYSNKQLTLKIILNARRDVDLNNEELRNKLVDKLDYAIAYHNSPNYKKYNDIVIGFDFVSEEDRGRPTSEYVKLIYENTTADVPVKAPRIDLIDFYLHDGESNWNTDNNIIDASIISKYRIGHGFNMVKYMGVANFLTYTAIETGYTYYCQSTFPILEVCPISNQLLRYFPDIRNHTAYQLMKSGIQCVLSNDDPFMFGNSGLSYDFWLAYVGMNLDFPSLKRLVYNSILPLNYGVTINNQDFDDKWDMFVNKALKNLTQ